MDEHSRWFAWSFEILKPLANLNQLVWKTLESKRCFQGSKDFGRYWITLILGVNNKYIFGLDWTRRYCRAHSRRFLCRNKNVKELGPVLFITVCQHFFTFILLKKIIRMCVMTRLYASPSGLGVIVDKKIGVIVLEWTYAENLKDSVYSTSQVYNLRRRFVALWMWGFHLWVPVIIPVCQTGI